MMTETTSELPSTANRTTTEHRIATKMRVFKLGSSAIDDDDAESETDSAVDAIDEDISVEMSILGGGSLSITAAAAAGLNECIIIVSIHLFLRSLFNFFL